MIDLLSSASLRKNAKILAPGAQTERPGDTESVGALLGG
jgi:hypothetical protein